MTPAALEAAAIERAEDDRQRRKAHNMAADFRIGVLTARVASIASRKGYSPADFFASLRPSEAETVDHVVAAWKSFADQIGVVRRQAE